MIVLSLMGDLPVDPHALGGGALVGVLLLFGREILQTIEKRTKAQIDSAERQAKITADCQLAIKQADIAKDTAKLEAKVDILEKSQATCMEESKKASSKLDDCEKSHIETKEKFAASQQDREAIHQRLSKIEASLKT
jgi:hypothetical protein